MQLSFNHIIQGKKEGIVVFSAFDGAGIAYQALKNLNIPVKKYYSSEIDKTAIRIAYKNHPDIIQLGDIRKVKKEYFAEKIDLMIGGSPCQDLSIAKQNRTGLKGNRSGLFYDFLRLRDELKPKYFLMENVNSMKQSERKIISNYLGVKPVMINSSLLTAQDRKRLYWIGELINSEYYQVNIKPPEDKGIVLADILEHGCTERLKSYCLDAHYYHTDDLGRYLTKKRRQKIFKSPELIYKVFGKDSRPYRVYSARGKSVTVVALGGGMGAKTGLYYTDDGCRTLTPLECERLQGYPEFYTSGISKTQRYKICGNGFTLPVIEYILSYFNFQ